MASGGLVRGISGDASFTAYRGEGIATMGIEIDSSSLAKFHAALDNPKPPTQALRDLMRKPAPWDVPNRLYGATLLEDGDVA